MDDHFKYMIFESIHNNDLYQKQVLTLACLIWGFLDVFSLTLPLLEIRPEVSVSYQGSTQTRTLTYQDCENGGYKLLEIQTGQSIIIYFDIYCNKYWVALIGSVNFLGVFFGTLVSPVLLDKIGRKIPVSISILAFIISLLGSTLANNIQVFLICIFFVGLSNLTAHISIFLLVNEITQKENRSIFSVIMFNSYAVFGIIFTWLFYYLDNWKKVFYLDLILCLILLILCCFYIDESPKYLLVKGDQKLYRNMYKHLNIYNKENDEKFLRNFLKNKKSKKELLNEEIHLNKKLIPNEVSSDTSNTDLYDNDNHTNFFEKESFSRLFKEGTRTVFLVMCFIWFYVSGTYYGIAIYLKELPGNIYITLTFMFCFEFFSNILSAVMMNNKHLGRKYSLMLLNFSGIVILILMFLVNKLNWSQNILTLAFRFIISTIYAIIYVYSTEYYPTVIRAKGLSMNTLCGRFGAIVSPFLVEIYEFNYFVMCLIVIICCFFSTFLLVETYNTELKNFVEDD